MKMYRSDVDGHTTIVSRFALLKKKKQTKVKTRVIHKHSIKCYIYNIIVVLKFHNKKINRTKTERKNNINNKQTILISVELTPYNFDYCMLHTIHCK